MPVLKQSRETTEVKLPESGGTARVYKEFLTGDYRQLMKGETVSTDTKEVSFDKGLDFVLKLIASWDFTDEEGKKLPITEKSLDLLPLSDLNILASMVGEVAKNSNVDADLKKNT